MSLDERKVREEAHRMLMEADFPPHGPAGPLPIDQRIAKALEYIAYQLGQINRKLGGPPQQT
jgi:hypothetical protein